jgi:cation diffusion facilitator CzcD-associated flavoprotein CzcO/predicted ATP-grasp superfamily ATP-dependent carboligase
VPDPLADEPGFIAALSAALASGRYAMVMPVTDVSLLALSAARDAIERHTRLALPPHDVVVQALDKLGLAPAASRHGLSPPATFICHGDNDAREAASSLGFPVVAKPLRSVVMRNGVRSQAGSRFASDDASLISLVADYGGSCLVQAVEAGAVVSMGGVFVAGRLLAQANSRYRRTWLPDAGSACYSETIEISPELNQRAAALLTELGWEGIFELELIERGPGDWAAIDLNPRPYGSLALAIGAGANLPAVWTAHALGIETAPVRARAGVVYRWEDADLRHALWQCRNGNVAAAGRVLRVHRHTVHPYFELRDPLPLLARTWSLAKGSARRVNGAAVRGPRREVVVIGAGPCGLAATAHLRAAGVPTRCFGEPLEAWRDHMPAGMLLRSSRRATHIAFPGRGLSIDRYESAGRATLRTPTLTREEFIEYGRWFQQMAVPDVDRRVISSVDADDGGYRLLLGDGEELQASRVVVAAGIAPFAHRPAPFAGLPPELVSHTAEHADLGQIARGRVIVIGGGQSALESAALLSELGADVELLVRSASIRWLADDTLAANGDGGRIPIPLPPTGVGGRATGWVAATPDLFRRLSSSLQDAVSARCIAPAGSGWLKPRLEDVTISCGRSVLSAEADRGRVALALDDGSVRSADHVLLGTGYKVDVSRYAFLGPTITASLLTANGYPVLGAGLESSLPGLHFLGAPAAFTFGPIMRFVVGTWYAAPALAARVSGTRQPPLNLSF